MEPEFFTYQKFEDPALAEYLIETLTEYGIEYYIQEEATGLVPPLVMGSTEVLYAVKIKSADFEKVNAILQEKENVDLNEVEADYYLFGFSDSELQEVITKADEWSPFDVVLARKILADKGVDLSKKVILEISEKRVTELKTIEPLKRSWIIIGYVFALGGGVAGVFFWLVSRDRQKNTS